MLDLGWFHFWLPAGRNTREGAGEVVKPHSKAKQSKALAAFLLTLDRIQEDNSQQPDLLKSMCLPALGLQSNLRILLSPDFLRKHCSESRRQNATVRIQILAMMYGAVRWAAACYPLPCRTDRQKSSASRQITGSPAIRKK